MSQMPSPDLINYYYNLQNWQNQQGQQAATQNNQLFVRMLQDAQRQQAEAKQANESRYQDILSDRVNTAGRVMGDVDAYGKSLYDDAARASKERTGASTASLSDLGYMGSPSMRNALKTTNSRADLTDLNRVRDNLLQARSGADERTSNDIDNFMERRTDAYPNTSGLNSLASQYGQMGVVGGGNAQALLGGGVLGGGFGAGGSGFQVTTSAPTMPRPPAPPAAPKPLDNPNNPYNPWNQTLGMIQQGYQPMGNNNYMRPGSGSGGNGMVPNQVVSGPPPFGTNVQQGQAQFGIPANALNTQGGDPYLRAMLGQLASQYGPRQAPGYPAQPGGTATMPTGQTQPSNGMAPRPYSPPSVPSNNMDWNGPAGANRLGSPGYGPYSTPQKLIPMNTPYPQAVGY